MTDWLKKYQSLFGTELESGFWAHEFKGWLRFELGGEVWGTNQPIRRFLQAHHRACAVSDFLFQDVTQLHAMVQSFGDKNSGINTCFSRLMTVLPNIQRHNFDFELPGSDREDDPEGREFWHVAPVDALQVKELLWLDLAKEMGISPAASGHLTYIVDFEGGVVLHAYDDRGMDIVSNDTELLQASYTKFNEWLLDYDRPRMKEAFEKPLT